MAKNRKRRRLRAEIKMYVVLFSLLASMITMMVGQTSNKNTSDIVVDTDGSDQTSSQEKSEIVVLDPGHGGHDSGSEFNGIYEKDIVLSIAKQTGSNLEKKGIKVLYTRTIDEALSEDEVVDLQKRIDFGIEHKASYFVSFHMNESPTVERSNGFEIFESSTSNQSSYLAQKVSDSLTSLNYTQTRAILEGSGLHVINFNPIPAILIELGFLDDDEDRLYLLSSEGQANVASAIAQSIYDSIENFK